VSRYLVRWRMSLIVILIVLLPGAAALGQTENTEENEAAEKLQAASLDLLLELKAASQLSKEGEEPFPAQVDNGGLARAIQNARNAPEKARSARLRVAAISFLCGEAGAATALADAAGASLLAELYRASIDHRGSEGSLSVNILHQALDEAGHRGWLRLALGRHLGSILGDETCRTKTEEAFAPRQRNQAALLFFVLGTAFLLGLAGVVLGLLAPWILPRIKLAGQTLGEAFVPSLPRGVAVVCLWLVALLVSGIASVWLREPLPWMNFELATAFQSLFAGLVALALIRFVALRRPGQGLSDALGIRAALGGRGLLWVLVLLAVSIPTVVGASLLNQKFLGAEHVNPLLARLMDNPDPANFVIIFVAVGVFAPVFEEALFRGYVFPLLRSRMGLLLASTLSGGIFAALHLDPAALLPLWILGILFAFAREWTGSLKASILLHSIWNVGNVLVVLTLVY